MQWCGRLPIGYAKRMGTGELGCERAKWRDGFILSGVHSYGPGQRGGLIRSAALEEGSAGIRTAYPAQGFPLVRACSTTPSTVATTKSGRSFWIPWPLPSATIWVPSGDKATISRCKPTSRS